MIGLLHWTVWAAIGWNAAHATPTELRTATEAELLRTMEQLTLPDDAAPYFVVMEILDGEVSTATASFGALDGIDNGPYRYARVEVRVGSAEVDNTNFDVAYGERNGVQIRALPHEDEPIAIRRELWLAADMAYKGATEQFAAKQSARDGHDDKHTDDLGASQPLTQESPFVFNSQSEWAEQIAKTISSAVTPFPELEEVNAVARDWQGQRLLVTSEGSRAWIPTGFALVRVEAIVRANDGAELWNARWWVAKTPELLPSDTEMAQAVQEMEMWLRTLRNAPVEEDYLGPVLFEEPAAVELFRQLLMPELSGTPQPEMPPDGYGVSSSVSDVARIGRRVLPEGWSVVDDAAAAPNRVGSYPHDQEGVAPQRVELVTNGVVQDVLMTRIPRKDRALSTGHARSLGANRRAAVPSVVTVSPKRSRSQKRVVRKALSLARQAGLDHVLVVRRVAPLSLQDEDRISFTGDAPLPGLTKPLECYRLYADGRQIPVRGMEFVGVDKRMLRDIVVAQRGSLTLDMMDGPPGPRRFHIGPVGGIPTTWSAPAVVVSEMELRSSGGKDPRIIPPPTLEETSSLQAPTEPAQAPPHQEAGLELP